MEFKADDFGKRKIYEEMVSMLSSLCEGQSDQAAILANAAALIKEKTGFFWVGFYLVRPCIPHKPLFDSEELRLGPFQGPVACYQIGRGKGVCGSSWLRAQTLVIPDVEEFPGHIACSSLSRSEIVVPLNRPRDGKDPRGREAEDALRGRKRVRRYPDLERRAQAGRRQDLHLRV